MRLYCGIDLHSNNSYVVVLDEQDCVVYRRRLRNDLHLILQELAPFAGILSGLTESVMVAVSPGALPPTPEPLPHETEIRETQTKRIDMRLS